MGLPEKPQVDGSMEAEGKKWVIAGIPLRTPLRPIYTSPVEKETAKEDEQECSTTPTAEEARIPAKLPCPPAPRKRKPSLRCVHSDATEFFTPPDLETLFKRRVERAS